MDGAGLGTGTRAFSATCELEVHQACQKPWTLWVSTVPKIKFLFIWISSIARYLAQVTASSWEARASDMLSFRSSQTYNVQHKTKLARKAKETVQQEPNYKNNRKYSQVRHGDLPITQHLRDKAEGQVFKRSFTYTCSGQPGLHEHTTTTHYYVL